MYGLRRNQIIYKENPDRILYYTTSNGQISQPYNTSSLYWGGANIVSNTYKNGVGKLQFDRDLTSVEASVFSSWSNSNIRTVKFPSKVSNIHSLWFGGDASQLTDIEVDSNNTTFESPANSHCVIKKSNNELIIGLANTVIPSTVRIIGQYAFKSMSLPSTFYIPAGVATLNYESFAETTINSLTIPSSITSINSSAFKNANITRIYVNDENLFYNDGNSSNYIMKTSNNELWYLPRQNNTIPSNTKIIGANACVNNTASSIVIPEGVTEIKDEAFRMDYGGRNLTTITLPSTLTTIGSNAFQYCMKVNSITCYAETAPSIQSWTFYYCGQSASGTKKLYYPAGSDYSTWLSNGNYYLGQFGFTGEMMGSFIKYTTTDNQVMNVNSGCFDANIESNTYSDGIGLILFDGPVTFIDEYTFANKTTLLTIDFKGLPNLTTLSDGIFSGCTSLTTISNLSIGTTVYDYMFSYCSSLTTPCLESGVTTIGSNAYFGNPFTKITVPNTVTSIGNFAFGDTSLCLKYNFTTFDSVPTLGTMAFNGINANAKILVKSDMEAAFKAAPGWSTYASYIESPQYTEVLCLKENSNEDAWIEFDDGNSDDSVIEIKFNIPSCSHSASKNVSLIGWWPGGDNVPGNYRILIFGNNTIFDQYQWSNRIQTNTSLINGDHVIKLVTCNSSTGKKELYVDGTLYSGTNNYRQYDNTNKFGLFGGHYESGTYCLDENSKVYYLKWWKNNVLIYDFIPVLDSNNVPCMYNKVDDTYWYSEGGQFLYETL